MQTTSQNNDPLSLKGQFLLDPEITFLNHGSFGATPEPVFADYQRWQRQLEYQPVKFLGRDATTLLAESRTELAAYLGTTRDNLVYVTNATFGLNIIARSLHLGQDDEVLATDHEYGALDRTWRFLAQQSGFKYINHPVTMPVSTPQQFVSDFWQSVTPRTRVIFISHITSPTALIFPVEEICRRAHQAGILTIIDGAHAPGQIPLNLDTLGADFYSGNLHKWLCAPKGAAFLYANPSVQHLVEPFIVSWGWQSEMPGPSPFVDILEWMGTRDLSAFLAVPAAIRFQQAHNWDAVRLRCHELAADTLFHISALTGLAPLSPIDPAWFAQMAAAPLPELDLVILKRRLYEEFHVEVPLIRWNNRNLIRFSFEGYNSAGDADILMTALKHLLAAA